MRGFLPVSKYLFLFLLFAVFTGSPLRAQIVCDYTLTKTESCSPFLIEATANETSPVGIFQRQWTITGPGGLNQVSPVNVNLNFSFVATVPGTYCLKLWSRNANGDTCSVTKCNLLVAADPTVNFTFAPTEGCSPLTVLATCNSTPGSGTIDSLAIDWGAGGAVYTGSSCPVTPINKVYTAIPGCVSPTVVVRNSYGCFSSITYTDEICIIPKPVANFTADTTVVNCATGPQAVNFTADSAGPNMTYHWYVNGTLVGSGPGRNFTHVFQVQQACYDVALKVTHPSGAACSDSLNKVGYICIRPLPVINFSKTISSSCINTGGSATMTFTDISLGQPSMTWTLTRGNPTLQTYPTQSGPSASFTVADTGQYYMTATGTFGPGCTSTITQQFAFNVQYRPVAFFTANDTFSCSVPFPVTYTATQCAGCTYQWSLPLSSNTSPTTFNPTVTYSSFVGQGYSSTLTVTALNGCTATLNRTFYVKTREINPKIGVSGKKGCAPLCVTFTDQTVYTQIPDPVSSVCWQFPGTGLAGACQPSVQRCFQNVGCHDVMLIVSTSTGCIDTTRMNDSICVGAPPSCSLTACAGTDCVSSDTFGTPLTMCFEEDTVLFNLTCDSFDHAKVIYGDGMIEAVFSQAFEHVYQDTGIFIAQVIPFNDSCYLDTLKISIQILPPITKFLDSTSCKLGDTLLLVNQSKGADTYKWRFLCTGDSSTVLNPTLLLPPCDTCRIRLETTNNNGCTHKAEKLINTPCSGASFIPLDTVGCITSSSPFTVTFVNTSNSTFPGTPTAWDFDCVPPNPFFSGFGTCSGNVCTATYPTPGVYTVAMRNRANNLCYDTVYTTVTVCRATVKFGPNSACYPLPVDFIDSSTAVGCSIASWKWTFGDGDSSSLQHPTHVYAQPGSYQVKLSVTTTVGCTYTLTKTVNVAPVNINYQIDTVICPGKQGCITNTSTGANLTYSWITNGVTYTTPSPCYTYPAPGDYPMYIRIVSAGQCEYRDTVTIHNQFPQIGGYVSTDTISCPNPPLFLQYTDTSLYVDQSWLWDFGDSAYSVFSNSNHAYSTPGNYVVTLTGTTQDGCTATGVIDTIVVKGPYGDFGFSPPGLCACKDTITFTVSTVDAVSLDILYGCLQGSASINPISPIGTVANPTILSFQVPYCVTDSCKPQLVFGDTSGCQNYIEGNYAYIDSPVVNFTFDNYGVCVNGTVCFQDLTTYTLPDFHSFTIKRIWDFGDGTIDSTSNDPAPCHYYGQVGGYDTKLYVYSNLGCVDSSVGLVVVVPEYPIAGFYADDSLVCANSPICFHDTSWIYPLTGPDYWVVNFGDGAIDTFQTGDFCHVYDTGGYYTVTMCVYDSVGCPDCDSSVVIRVIDNPLANAGGDRIICYGIPTQLNGTGGTIPHWEPAGLFSDPDSYSPAVLLYSDTSITFYVGDQYGCRDTDYAVLTVAQVFADFTVGTTFCEKTPVCVTDNSTNVNGTLVSWTYDFGDGVSQIGPDTCHIYYLPGLIPITEVVTDTNGCTDTAVKSVVILPSPNAAFSANDTIICNTQPLCLTDLTTSTTAIASWSWNYGGVHSSSSATPPCYLFNPPYQSTYDVVLVVVDQNTCRDTAILTVTLNEVPSANFTWSTSCESEPMPFTNTSVQGDGSIIGCEWLFWVGSPNPVVSSTCNASYQFPAGSYPVQLVVTDVNGCTDTIVKTVMSDSISQLVIYPGDTTICLGTSVQYNVSGIFDNIIWTPSTWIDNPNSSTVTITPLGNIGYIISATNGVCVAASDTFVIRTLQKIPIEAKATPEQVVLGLSSNITSQIGGQIDSIVWSPDATLDCRECPNPIALPTQTTTYYATIYYSENGITCTTIDSVTIVVLKVCDNSIVYVPNTFTPNDDGLNDVFMIRGLAATRINFFRIFDRWGKLVFETSGGQPNDPSWGWNGNDRSGEKLNSAVYVYTYEIECINGDIVTGQGNVTLIR